MALKAPDVFSISHQISLWNPQIMVRSMTSRISWQFRRNSNWINEDEVKFRFSTPRLQSFPEKCRVNVLRHDLRRGFLSFSLNHGHNHEHCEEHEHDHEHEQDVDDKIHISDGHCCGRHCDHFSIDQEHGHDHAHGHSHTHNLNGLQRLLLSFSNATGLAKVASLLRDDLRICCLSFGLLFTAAIIPKIWPAAIGHSLQSTFTIIAFMLTGVPAALDAGVDIAGGKINIHVLMALAAFASFFMGNGLEGGLLLAMFSLSHQAEEYFTKKALGDVKALKESNPEFALVLDDFDIQSPLQAMKYKQVDVSKVEIGSYLLVRAGEAVPVDGEVWQGRSMITVEHLTGEAHPLEKQVGDVVPGGARNLDGMMVVKATKTWQDSTISRIMKLTEEAHANRPKLQRWLDDFGEVYSQVVIVMSAVLALLGPFLFKWPFMGTSGVRGSLYRALGLMVAASPCALAVAPLAYATAISACASKGILLKGGEALDALAACDTVAFDKTGTLTTGELVCKAIEPIHGHVISFGSGQASCCNPSCEVEALAVAAAMERGATHPIARAVVEHSEGKSLPAVIIDDFESLPGRGLAALVTSAEEKNGSSKALLGSLDYVTSSLCNGSISHKIIAAMKKSVYGNEMVHAALSVNEKVTLFHFEDKIRSGADAVLTSLKAGGLKLMMLTGDHLASARRVANAVGIEEVYSGLKPEDKLHHVKNFSRHRRRSNGGGLVMVGDGINDAPALAAATVGIVLAQRASATAIAVADVLLLKDAIDGVPFVMAKARQTMSLVKQNVALALISILIAASTSVLGFLPLWITVLLHEGGTLLVCVNSIRALNDPIWFWQLRHDFNRALKKLNSLIHSQSNGTDHAVQGAGLS